MVDVSILLQQVTAAMAPPRHATYRLQLGAALGFEGVADLAPYLSALGVSDAYLSPCFKCGPGSSHGYDVTDHNAFNPEVGSAAHELDQPECRLRRGRRRVRHPAARPG